MKIATNRSIQAFHSIVDAILLAVLLRNICYVQHSYFFPIIIRIAKHSRPFVDAADKFLLCSPCYLH